MAEGVGIQRISAIVSDVAIFIADALRAFLTAKVVFLKEHGSVAWSGSARSELADLCLLSALTPDAERRKYSALGSRNLRYTHRAV